RLRHRVRGRTAEPIERRGYDRVRVLFAKLLRRFLEGLGSRLGLGRMSRGSTGGRRFTDHGFHGAARLDGPNLLIELDPPIGQ
ncbi:MAG: hypothetical protein WBQ66_19315, partial [Blastocatellia bacterium]